MQRPQSKVANLHPGWCMKAVAYRQSCIGTCPDILNTDDVIPNGFRNNDRYSIKETDNDELYGNMSHTSMFNDRIHSKIPRKQCQCPSDDRKETDARDARKWHVIVIHLSGGIGPGYGNDKRQNSDEHLMIRSGRKHIHYIVLWNDDNALCIMKFMVV